MGKYKIYSIFKYNQIKHQSILPHLKIYDLEYAYWLHTKMQIFDYYGFWEVETYIDLFLLDDWKLHEF